MQVESVLVSYDGGLWVCLLYWGMPNQVQIWGEFKKGKEIDFLDNKKGEIH